MVHFRFLVLFDFTCTNVLDKTFKKEKIRIRYYSHQALKHCSFYLILGRKKFLWGQYLSLKMISYPYMEAESQIPLCDSSFHGSLNTTFFSLQMKDICSFNSVCCGAQVWHIHVGSPLGRKKTASRTLKSYSGGG